MKISLCCTLIIWLASAGRLTAASGSLDSLIEQELGGLVGTYQAFHAAPELSGHEVKTSAALARMLAEAGYTVTEGIGKYQRSDATPCGLVAVLTNGPGKTLLIRADMDGLPVTEKTGLAYASQVKTKSASGESQGVMHACGHDIHMTSLLGAAKVLAKVKDQWHGRLLLIGQPAEESGEGARAMLEDRLYARFGRPDFAFAIHDNSSLETGKLGYCAGFAHASSTTVKLTVRGVGGHASTPERTRDPIVIAAQVVLGVQTIVSREKSPAEPAVVTIGSIHGGTRANIIPDEVELLFSIRTYKEEVLQHILASIERIARGCAEAAGVPEDRAPVMAVRESIPACYNNPELTQRLAEVFKRSFGAGNVLDLPPVMGSEDFGRFSLGDHSVPAVMFSVGAVSPAKWAASKREGTVLPSLHSATFAPDAGPTIKNGVKAMAGAALELLK